MEDKKIAIDLIRYNFQMLSLRIAKSNLHSKDGMSKLGEDLDVSGIREMHDIYKGLTQVINSLETLLDKDIQDLERAGENQVQFDSEAAR